MRKLAAILFAIIILSTIATAAKIPTPLEAPDGATLISPEKVKAIIKDNVVHVFDTRRTLKYNKGHIPGAVSISLQWTKKGLPEQRSAEFDMSTLPSDKKAKIIFHSTDSDGWKSYHAAKNAKKAGYENIMWLRDGYSGWIKKGYAVE